jgi:putative lipoprotein
MNLPKHKLWLLAAFLTGMNLCTGGAARAQEQNTPAGQPAPARDPQEHNNVRAAAKWQRFDYTCAGNTKLVVYLHDGSAKVYYQDHLYLMRQTSAADGARYSDGKVAWWSKGDDGFLQEEDTEVGEGQKIARDCYRVATATESPKATMVAGTLTYLVRMALPPQAVVQVQLLDLSREGSGAQVAEQKFALGQHGVPVPFTLKVDSSKIDPKHTYGVSARILLVGELRFATQEPYKVLTLGNPSKVDMVLLPAGGPKH